MAKVKWLNDKWFRASLMVGLPVVVVALLLLLAKGQPMLAEGPALAAAYDPPDHKALSGQRVTPESRNEIAANSQAMVVVWQESTDPAGGDVGIRMRFKREGQAWQEVNEIWPYRAVPERRGAEPAVDLHNLIAHVVWIDQDDSLLYLKWNLQTNRCAVEGKDTEIPLNCWEKISDDNDPKSRPQVAVDASGIPHVVWVENYWDGAQGQAVDYIYYDNRNGATWGTDVQIATPISEPGWIDTENRHPAIAADGQYVYVAWVVDDQATATSDCGDGIHFRRRNGIGESASWSPALGSRAKALSAFPAGTCASASPDSWPTVDVVNGKLFVLWQRQAQKSTIWGIPVYTYTMNYRVLTGSNVGTNWSPSPVPTSTTAMLPVRVNSKFADGEQDDYSGVRPVVQLVQSGSVISSYVAWHGWTPPASGSSARDSWADEPAGLTVQPQGSEDFIDRDRPYQVFYAHAGHTNLANLSQKWSTPITIPVRVETSIHCSPDFAVVSYGGGVYFPHFSLLKRSNAAVGTKNVWYTNQYFSLDVYVPLIFRNKAN